MFLSSAQAAPANSGNGAANAANHYRTSRELVIERRAGREPSSPQCWHCWYAPYPDQSNLKGLVLRGIASCPQKSACGTCVRDLFLQAEYRCTKFCTAEHFTTEAWTEEQVKHICHQEARLHAATRA